MFKTMARLFVPFVEEAQRDWKERLRFWVLSDYIKRGANITMFMGDGLTKNGVVGDINRSALKDGYFLFDVLDPDKIELISIERYLYSLLSIYPGDWEVIENGGMLFVTANKHHIHSSLSYQPISLIIR